MRGWCELEWERFGSKEGSRTWLASMARSLPIRSNEIDDHNEVFCSDFFCYYLALKALDCTANNNVVSSACWRSSFRICRSYCALLQQSHQFPHCISKPQPLCRPQRECTAWDHHSLNLLTSWIETTLSGNGSPSRLKDLSNIRSVRNSPSSLLREVIDLQSGMECTCVRSLVINRTPDRNASLVESGIDSIDRGRDFIEGIFRAT